MESLKLKPRSETSQRKYYILTELGQGGTAVVNAAVARGMGGFSKLVVLKQIKAEFSEQHDAIGMFLNEARLSSRMNHPNVVQVYEVFEEHGLPVIVMEYLEGQSFARILSRVCLDPIASGYSTEVVVSIICRALEGLHYAHTLRGFNGKPLEIIHRDATPHNIMVTYTGQVKLLDFGIAKLNSSSDHTKTGVVKGKLGYMPREQIDGSRLNCRADVFSMGVILWESIARRRLWKGISEAQIVRNLVCNEIPLLSSVFPEAPPELCKICARAMAPNSEDRYPTALDMFAALENFLESRGGIAPASTIAQLVDDSCKDLRIAAKKTFDEQLANFSARDDGSWNSDDGISIVAPGEQATRATRPISREGSSSIGSCVQDSLSELPIRKVSRSIVWAASALLALAVLGVFWIQQKPSVSTVRSVANTPAPRLDDPESKPTIRLKIAASPQTAAIYLDGIRSTNNPHNAIVLQDNRKHELRILAPGFVPQQSTLDFSEDRELSIALRAKPEPTVQRKQETSEEAENTAPSIAPPAQRKRAKRKRRKTRRAVPQRAAPQPAKPRVTESKAPTVTGQVAKPADCAPPYFIDKSGIKQYRRECL